MTPAKDASVGGASDSVPAPPGMGFLMKVCIAVAVLGGFIYGYDLGVLVGVLPDIVAEFALSSWEEGFVVGLASWGGIIGAILGGYIADRYGRRRCMMLQCLCFMVGACVQASAESVAVFGVGRVVTGVGFSLSTLSNLAWISEIVPSRVRGQCVAMYELSVTAGVFFAFVINKADPSWRWAIGASGIIAAVEAMLLALVPESPVWLLLRGQLDEAQRVFAYLRFTRDHVDECTRLAGAASDEEEQGTDTVGSAPRDTGFAAAVRRWWVPFVVVLTIQALGLMTGGVNIRVYAISIMRDDFGLSKSTAGSVGILLGVVKVVFTLFSVMTLDRFGRKVFYKVGMGLLLVANAFIAAGAVPMGCRGDETCATGSNNATAVPDCATCPALCGQCPTWSIVLVVTGCVLGYAAYQLSFGPVNFALGSELFPPAVRARFLGTQYVTQAVFQLITTTFFPVLWSEMGLSFTMMIHTVFCAGGIAFVAYAMVETSHKSPTDILHELNVLWGQVEAAAIPTGPDADAAMQQPVPPREVGGTTVSVQSIEETPA